VDLETGVLSYCNAGHNPFCIMKPNGQVTSDIQVHGVPLGVIPDMQYGVSQINLEPGDTIFFYTDGVTEAHNTRGGLWGMDALIETLASEAIRMSSPKQINNVVRKAIQDFAGGAEQFDDITVLTFKFTDFAKVAGRMQL